jgi:hypothetical protein
LLPSQPWSRFPACWRRWAAARHHAVRHLRRTSQRHLRLSAARLRRHRPRSPPRPPGVSNARCFLLVGLLGRPRCPACKRRAPSDARLRSAARTILNSPA